MKKILSLILACLMVASLAACGSSSAEPAEYTGLQAGYGRADVSPLAPMGMDGYGDRDERLSGDILDPTYATCVAIKQGESTFLLFTVDVLSCQDSIANRLRDSIKSELGIPQENIIIGATHTHSAVTWNGGTSTGCIQAAKDAIADLAPATMTAATTTLEGMNFVRHYLMNDGTYYGSNFGSTESGFKAHAIDVDPELSMISLAREGKKDIWMVNWQAHPASAARQDSYTGISADFVGYARKKVELEANVHFAYYTGAAGNVNPRSHIDGETPASSKTYQSYGASLGGLIIEAMKKLQPTEGNEMMTARNKFVVEVDHSWDHMAAEASRVVAAWKQQGLEAGHKMAREYGFSSAYHASAITTRSVYKGEQTKTLTALRVGNVAFINNDYEMFCDHGQYVKEKSPFDVTFVITGCSGYIANELAYSYRSYESDTSPYVSGTGEKLAEEMARLLNTMK